MALKRATFYTYGKDETCTEIQKFIEDAGIILDIRDIELRPLTLDEIKKIIGHINLNHFLNTFSESYAKYHLDDGLPAREEVYELIANDHTLLKRPIIKSARLMTVGYDKKKIAELFQISNNGSDVNEEPRGNIKRNYHHRSETSSGVSGK